MRQGCGIQSCGPRPGTLPMGAGGAASALPAEASLGRVPLTASSLWPVCRRFLEQVVSCSGLLPAAGLPEEQTVTWFQFHSYLQRQSVSDLEKHFAQLTKEGRGHAGQPGSQSKLQTGSVCGSCPGSQKPIGSLGYNSVSATFPSNYCFGIPD